MGLRILFVLSCLTVVGLYAQTAYQTAGLNSHNSYRTKHRSQPMTLSASLNAAALNCSSYYAAARKIDHSCKTPSNAGECLYMTWGQTSPPDPTTVTNTGIQSWYNEVSGYNYQSPGSSTGVIGHFTQMVWNASTQVGFGVSTVNGYTVVVAKYLPWGNVYGYGTDGYQAYRDNVFPPTTTG